MAVETRKRYLLGDLVLEPTARHLSKGGVPVHLTRKPFQVLLYLVEHHDRLVTRRELLDHFWEGHDVYDETLTKCVGAIRKALDDQTERPRFIETHWSEGYRFVCQVEEQLIPPETAVVEIEKTQGVKIDVAQEGNHNALLADQENLPPVARPLPLPGPRRLSRLVSLAIICAFIALIATTLYFYRQRSALSGHSSTPIRSIAVLPLKNLTNDPANEYFSDGMTDSLITALSKVDGLKVISRGSVFRFKGQEIDPREVGKQLGVASVLEGSVRKDGDSVRVAVRLVSADDGRVLWTSEMYNRAMQDIFGLQDEIARSTVAGLKVKLSGEGEARLARRYTDNVEAYQLYLNGRYHWNKRTEEGLKQGIEYFEKAIAKDPGYAQAYAGLADSYILMGVGDYGVLPPKEAMPKAKEAALKALEIDDTLAEAHTSLGFLNYVFDWDWPGAESHFRRAIELNPNYVTAHHWYGLYLGVMGRFDEGIEQTQRALELDPSSLIINTDLGLIFCYARQPDRAIEQLRKTLEREPNFVVARWRLARAYAQKAMYQEAISELQKAIEVAGRRPYYISLMGYVDALAGKRAEALSILNELRGLPLSQEKLPALIAAVYVGLGDRDRAFEWLDKAYKERFAALIALKVEPMFDNLRSDPRFQDLQRRVGLGQ